MTMEMTRRALIYLAGGKNQAAVDLPPWHGMHLHSLALEMHVSQTGFADNFGWYAAASVWRHANLVAPDRYLLGADFNETLGLHERLPSEMSALISAYQVGELRGRYEESAAHQIFWEAVVKTDAGIRLLFSLHPDSGRFYAQHRWLTSKCPNCRKYSGTTPEYGPSNKESARRTGIMLAEREIMRTCSGCGHMDVQSRDVVEACPPEASGSEARP